MKKKIIAILLPVVLIGLLSACSSSKEKNNDTIIESSKKEYISLADELISGNVPIVGDLRDETESYWKNSYNYESAKKYISIDGTIEFNSSNQDNTKVYYDTYKENQCYKIGKIEINLLEFEEFNNKEMKEILSIAKSLINKEIQFDVYEEELTLEISSSGERTISYHLSLSSDNIVDDNYKGNVNGYNKPYEEIRIMKSENKLYLQVGYFRTRTYLNTQYIELDPTLINNESVLTEILNIEDVEFIKDKYLVKN